MARQQVAGQKAGQGAQHARTTPDPEWKPSRFFDAWKESLVTMEDSLVLQYLQYCRGMPPDVKRHAVDHILRGTMPDIYRSADRDEAFGAMDNDIDAMREHAARFLDKFWKERWADFIAKYPFEEDDRRSAPPAARQCAPLL